MRRREVMCEAKLRETVENLELVANRMQGCIAILERVEAGNPEGCTRDVAENAQRRLRVVRDACINEVQVLKRDARTFCDGPGCEEWLYIDELAEQLDGDLLCPRCALRAQENQAELEGMARAADLANGGGIDR
jgi:hypothetical protein